MRHRINLELNKQRSLCTRRIHRQYYFHPGQYERAEDRELRHGKGAVSALPRAMAMILAGVARVNAIALG